MSPALPQTLTPAQAESRDSAVLVDVLVLSTDLLLFDAIRGAIGERNPVWRARSAEESVDLLLTGRCGVLLVDMAAVSGTPTTLISQMAEQFPDLVIVVAGRREDEALLAQLISSGCVYRFMHKPITAKRAGMFLQAAVRRHAELRGATTRAPLIPLTAVLPGRFDPRKWMFVGAGVLIFVAMLWFAGGGSQRDAMPDAGEPADPPPARAAAPSTPLSDPVLSRARAAYAAGRYESPPGRNALDLYAAVLLSNPDQPEAREGLDATVARVADSARAASASGDADEAMRLLARLQDVAPQMPDVGGLEAELASLPAQGGRPSRSSGIALSAGPPVPATAQPPGRSSGIALSAGPPVSASAQPPGRSSGIALSAGPPVPAAAQPPGRSSGIASSAGPPVPASAQPPGRSSGIALSAATSTAVPSSRNDADLPVPVTRLPRATATPKPKATQPRVVQSDPLAPRIANSDELRLRELALREASAKLRSPRASGPVAPTGGTAQSTVAARTAVEAPADDELGRVRVVEPVYPPQAMRDRVEGWVLLEFTITENGSVRDIVVVDSQPSGVFDAAATEALAGWKYRPRITDGRPVAHRSNVTMRFDLGG